MDEIAENIHGTVLSLTGSNDFMQAVSDMSDIGFQSLMYIAAAQWEQISNALKQSEFEVLPIGPIAEAASLSSPRPATTILSEDFLTSRVHNASWTNGEWASSKSALFCQS